MDMADMQGHVTYFLRNMYNTMAEGLPPMTLQEATEQDAADKRQKLRLDKLAAQAKEEVAN